MKQEKYRISKICRFDLPPSVAFSILLECAEPAKVHPRVPVPLQSFDLCTLSLFCEFSIRNPASSALRDLSMVTRKVVIEIEMRRHHHRCYLT